MKRLTLLIALLLLTALAAWAQRIVDPQILQQQELQKKRALESGFGDIEIDLLHREIREKLPKLMTSAFLDKKRFVKENQGVYTFELPIANGESIKSISERYIYNGKVVLYTDKEGTKLDLIKLEFRRLNPFGTKFLEEKREIENPSPLAPTDGSIDRNLDIRIIYYDTAPPKDEYGFDIQEPIVADFSDLEKSNFKEKFQTTLEKVPFFEKQIAIMETYKKYLRRTSKRIQKKLEDLELKHRVQLQKILDVK